MKRLLSFFLLLVLAPLSAVLADDLPGIRANIELVTGTKQTVQFLGVNQDTVSLGGVIQGKFTVVHILKDRIKSIVDEQGNDLMNISKTPAALSSDSSSVVQDSSQAAEAQQDSSTKPLPQPAPVFLDSVQGKHVFVAMEHRAIDSVLAEQITPIIIRLLQESGTPVVIAKRTDFGYCRDNACIKDSLATYGAASAYLGRIAPASSNDSISIQASHYSFIDSANHDGDIAKMNLSVFKSISDATSGNKLKHFIMQLQGEAIPVQAAKRSYIHVETDPEGATLALSSQGDICRTPCTFATKDSGKVTLYAYWGVDKQLWGASSTVNPIGSDTIKISLKLKPVRPELRVFSIPGDAEIYAGSSQLSIDSKPIGHTPDKYPIYEPGMSTVQLRKAGYRDTMVTVFVPPTELTDINVEMEPIRDLEELKAQEEWIHQRKVSRIGKTLMGASIAPIVIGALFTYLANQDYDDADKIKQELERPASSAGATFQEKIKENHDLVKKGDRKMIAGGSLIGGGLIMLSVGFVLAF
ncbi:MAG: PEGA domain-containing protein [Fibrobacter sp.]|nr:PEGA domain-containing protein [Fibrobacter sp.]